MHSLLRSRNWNPSLKATAKLSEFLEARFSQSFCVSGGYGRAAPLFRVASVARRTHASRIDFPQARFLPSGGSDDHQRIAPAQIRTCVTARSSGCSTVGEVEDAFSVRGCRFRRQLRAIHRAIYLLMKNAAR
jgi:hypothetical protein